MKSAASHLVPNTFSPRTFGPPQLVPKNKQSQPIWSPWTNGPLDNWSPSTNSPRSFGPHRQMVPQNVVPLDKSSANNSVHLIPDPHNLSPWTNRIFLGPFVQGAQIGWVTICPGDQIFWDHLSRGTELVGDRLSRGTN